MHIRNNVVRQFAYMTRPSMIACEPRLIPPTVTVTSVQVPDMAAIQAGCSRRHTSLRDYRKGAGNVR
jgi:hypothetical protein